MVELFAITLLATIAAQLAPGPNFLAVAATALGQGRMAGLAVAAGVASGVFFWVIVVAFGLGSLLELAPALLLLLKIAGGLYLIYLAARGLRAGIQGEAVNLSADARSRSLKSNWQMGMLVVVTNPKAALMWIAMATFIFAGGGTWLHVLLFGPLGALSALAVYGLYAWLFSTNIAIRSYQKFSRVFEYSFASLFGLFGGKLLWDGLKELRT
ncbi:MAG: LysE family translocator [Rhizobiaceae bacterium]|nr:LysE family translocator [Rhizobiaceae bacterium]